jgi:hypothetical protein
VTDEIVPGISGWFTPHGVLYYKDIRSVTEIVPKDWTALLARADEIGFSYGRSLGRRDLPIASCTSRSHWASDPANWRSTTPSRDRTRASDPPGQTCPEQPQVLTPETLGDEAFAVLLATQAAGPGYERSACTQA